MAEPLKDKETIKIKYTIGNSPEYKDGYEKGLKDGKKEVWLILLIYAVLTLLSIFFVSKCNAQDSSNNLHKWSINSLTISKSETVQQDTIPVTLLVRISGKPWAFFHDGWEVRKVDSAEMKKSVFANAHGYVPSIYVVETVPIYSHLLYLDSKKRPIRKEWVVYQTFKR